MSFLRFRQPKTPKRYEPITSDKIKIKFVDQLVRSNDLGLAAAIRTAVIYTVPKNHALVLHRAFISGAQTVAALSEMDIRVWTPAPGVVPVVAGYLLRVYFNAGAASERNVNVNFGNGLEELHPQ